MTHELCVWLAKILSFCYNKSTNADVLTNHEKGLINKSKTTQN